MQPLHGELLALAAELGKPLLALDTSGPISSLCVVSPERHAVLERQPVAASLPSDSVVATLAEAFSELRLRASDLGAVVVGLGPGSFTGLRVGLSTVKGLCYGATVPIYGTSSLALLAAACDPGLVVVVLDARKEEIYTGTYRVSALGAEVVAADRAMTLGALVLELSKQSERCVFVGDHAASVCEALGSGQVVEGAARAAFGLLHERGRIVARAADDLFTLVPRYLKVSEPERRR